MIKKNFWQTFWGGVTITIIILAGIYLGWRLIKRGGIVFSVNGPEEVKSGELVPFIIQCSNNSRVVLENAQINVYLPDGVFSSENSQQRIVSYSLGEIAPHNEINKKVPLIITGNSQTAKHLKVVLRYRPKTLSAYFARQVDKTILINGSVFSLNLSYPNQVFQGQTFPLKINWENTTNQSFPAIEVHPEWPSGVTIQDSNPPLVSETGGVGYWNLGSLSGASQGQIMGTIAIAGEVGETKRVGLVLGMRENNKFYPITKAEGYFELIENPLAISSLINNQTVVSANLGDTLNFTLNYKNNYSTSLRDLNIKTTFKGDAFDYSTVQASRGHFSSRYHTITWTGNDVSQLYSLPSGASGQLHFSIKLKRDWPMVSLAQKNTILTVQSVIQGHNTVANEENAVSQDIPQGVCSDTIKLNSLVQLSQESYFRDPASHLVNTGSLPLRVNQPVTFTIHWKIKNTFNSLKNVEVATVLPDYVNFTGKVAGNYGVNLPQYNAANHQLSWSIPLLSAGAGTIARPLEAIFQIKVTPSSSQSYQAINLLGNTTLQGIDGFTQNNVDITIPPLRSDQLTDKTIFPGAGVVQP